ncbi:copalyl diphosphate synthase [Trichophyton mentagrophytes]|nr:copalyl diphosphate synthase [Trichophyton mentagrophytes]
MGVQHADLGGVADLETSARLLIKRSFKGHDPKYGNGSMSCTTYDTAWVSLVTKTVGEQKHWLFPECFRSLLRTQSDDGGWRRETTSQVDCIVNTAAALLSLKRHAVEPLQLGEEVHPDDLERRIHRGAMLLRSQLEEWRVSETMHVGFEIIVPKLLALLEEADAKFSFCFEGRDELVKINAAKLARFKPEALYGTVKMTMLHSLEAFVGEIDFDKVAHHKVVGSMMGSPSSTAAYLMNSTDWDDEAESYLRHVIHSASGQGSGAVPSAFPSTYFEYSWILSTLLEAGFSASDLRCPELEQIYEILTRAFSNGDGTIGYAPDFQPDMDDTARGMIALNLLGGAARPEPMIKSFEAATHFRTYQCERNPSFSANCNALLTILHQPDVSLYTPQILKVVNFLCDSWWNTDGKIADKWSLSPLYPSVLLVKSLVKLLALAEQEDSSPGQLLGQDLASRVAITVFQACLRAMLDQHEDGSWNSSTEQTAYGVLILTEARPLCFLDDIRDSLDSAIGRGVSFLHANRGSQVGNFIWIEKVTYASPLLAEAYELAAIKAATSLSSSASSVGGSLWCVSTANTTKLVKLFQQTPLFTSLPEWQIRASMIEARLFQPLLQARRLEVFPRKDMEKDKYFEIIPFTWTACNNRNRAFASTSFLYDMMVISFLNYQADEFLEAVAGPQYTSRTPELRQVIDTLFSGKSSNSEFLRGVKRPYPEEDEEHRNGNNGKSQNNREVVLPLTKFTTFVLNHPSVKSASAWDRNGLRRRLKEFLLAHVTQIEDNTRFQLEHPSSGGVYSTATDSFSHWVRTTSAEHTSCPYSFQFVSCLLGASLGQGKDCFGTAEEKYMATSVCNHLSTMCRMYNDYGSVARDKAEGNVNSVNFPELQMLAGSTGPATMEEKKKALFRLAEYERSCLDDAFKRLQAEGQRAASHMARKLHERKMEVWRMFCDVTDLYGQIYVVRDIASRMKVPAVNGKK